jgi:hypothetical protein
MAPLQSLATLLALPITALAITLPDLGLPINLNPGYPTTPGYPATPVYTTAPGYPTWYECRAFP